jgi:hypothetical protein
VQYAGNIYKQRKILGMRGRNAATALDGLGNDTQPASDGPYGEARPRQERNCRRQDDVLRNLRSRDSRVASGISLRFYALRDDVTSASALFVDDHAPLFHLICPLAAPHRRTLSDRFERGRRLL